MSEPRRPEPDQRWTDRLRERHVRWRDELRLRRHANHAPPVVSTDGPDPDAARGRSSVLSGLAVVGSALLALGLVWGWQVWANRSAEPIDLLMPVLADPVMADSAAGETPSPIDAVVPQAGEQGPGASSANESTGDIVAAATDGDDGSADARPDRAEPTEQAQLIVHVSGAVTSPGVVALTPGARVFEAVERAGGATDVADLDRVNLAAPVVDGERIHVPNHDETVAPALVPSVRPASGSEPEAGADDPVIDINSATASELEALPGVGPSIAQAIVQTRVNRGPFLNLDELLDVPGIGETKLAQMRPFATVEP